MKKIAFVAAAVMMSMNAAHAALPTASATADVIVIEDVTLTLSATGGNVSLSTAKVAGTKVFDVTVAATNLPVASASGNTSVVVSTPASNYDAATSDWVATKSDDATQKLSFRPDTSVAGWVLNGDEFAFSQAAGGTMNATLPMLTTGNNSALVAGTYNGRFEAKIVTN